MLGACGGNPSPPVTNAPTILTLAAADPLIEGSELLLTLSDADRVGDTPSLRITGALGEVALPAVSADGALRVFQVSADALTTFGASTGDFVLVVEGLGVSTQEYTATLHFAAGAPLHVDRPSATRAHYEEGYLLSGGGFLAEPEGLVQARLLGRYTPDGAGALDVDVTLAVTPAERFSRDRGLMRVTTALGGGASGNFSGTLEVRSTTASGRSESAGAMPFDLQILPAELFALGLS